jgi:PAS domain S-box-containing protein
MSTDRSDGEWNLAVRQQAAVAHLGQYGLRSRDLEEVLREALVVAADTLAIDEVALFELRADGVLQGRAALRDGRPVPRASAARVIAKPGTASLPGFTVEQRLPVVSPDMVADGRYVPAGRAAGLPVRSAVSAPIAWAERPFGVLVVYDREVRTWTDDEVHFVQAVANTIGLAVQRSQIERELRDSSTRLDVSLSAGGLGAWSWSLDGDHLTFNGSALAMYGLSTDAFDGSGTSFFALVHPEDRDAFERDTRLAVAAGIDHHHEFRIIRPDTGEVRWIESSGRLITEDDGSAHVVGVCSDVTDRRRSEALRAAAFEREQVARLEAEEARERVAFLAEASAVLSDSLDPQVTLERLADLCVPTFAEVVFIDLADEDDVLREQVSRAASEAKLLDAQALRRRRRELGPKAPTETGHGLALLGRGLVYTIITDQQLVDAASDPDHLALFRRFAPRSTVMVPLVSRGRPIGVMTLIRTGDAEPYTDDVDLGFFESLASRAALAIDNGRLFHSRNRIARSLQEALLPPAMPEVDGLDLGARYLVAEADAEIGGDFYDVVQVGPRSWGVMIGDVCGRGPDAAALTGLVRHTLRSAVLRDRGPRTALANTNAAVLQQIDDARFCTAAYLRVDLPEDGRSGPASIVVASAGHPRPVLVRADGTVELLECAGTLLGVVDDPELVEVRAELHPGDAVVLYTDGVTEARRGADLFGEERLVELLAQLPDRPAAEVAEAIEREVSAFRRHANDDTAIVVLRALDPA